MKKVILIAALVVIVAAVGLPPVIGSMTESNFRAHIEQMDENPMFAMRVSEYDGGWFTSRAEVRVSLDERYLEMIASAPSDVDAGQAELAAMMTEQSIGIPVNFAHGPIILMDGLYFGLSRLHAVLDDSDEFAAMATLELGLDYLAELHGQVSYFGTFSFSSNVPPIEYLHEAGQISFSGLNLDGTARGRNLQMDGGMESLVMDADGTAITIDNFDITSDSTRINHLLWAGDFDGEVERITFVDTLAGADGAAELSGLRIFGGADLDDSGELLDIAGTYAISSIQIPSEELEVTDAELTIGLENLSVAALTDYYEASMSIDPANPAAAAMALQNISLRLLETNPTISFDPIRFTLDGEMLTAGISVRTVNGDQANIDLSNPIMLLGLFEASANLRAAKPLFEMLAGRAAGAQLSSIDPTQLPPGQDLEAMAQAQANLMIISLLGEGYIEDDGENYSTAIEYANGEVRVNGMPIPLGALLQ